MPKVVDARVKAFGVRRRDLAGDSQGGAAGRHAAPRGRGGALHDGRADALFQQSRSAAGAGVMRGPFRSGGADGCGGAHVRGDLKRLETLVLEALPLDALRMNEWKTHLTFWGEACDNEKLRSENARRFAEWGQLLEEYMAPIVPGHKARRREAMLLMGLIDGLALRLVLQARRGSRIQADATEVADAVRSHLQAMQARY